MFGVKINRMFYLTVQQEQMLKVTLLDLLPFVRLLQQSIFSFLRFKDLFLSLSFVEHASERRSVIGM